MPQELGAEFADELRAVLGGPIAKQNGVVAQQRADSILAVFGNAPEDKPDHAQRALHAAVLAVYEAAELNRRLAARLRNAAVPPLALAAGVHLGRVEVIGRLRPATAALVRAIGEAVEIARVLECTAPDVGWSIVASEQARRAAGARIESGRVGSVALPDSSFVDIAEITGLQPQKDSRNPAQTYLALQDAISLNRQQYGRHAGSRGRGERGGAQRGDAFLDRGLPHRAQDRRGRHGLDLPRQRARRRAAGTQGDAHRRPTKATTCSASSRSSRCSRR